MHSVIHLFFTLSTKVNLLIYSLVIFHFSELCAILWENELEVCLTFKSSPQDNRFFFFQDAFLHNCYWLSVIVKLVTFGFSGINQALFYNMFINHYKHLELMIGGFEPDTTVFRIIS